ncbi:ATP-binding protein [Spongiactinospora rosea]|uniref:ATP-binding protein n=1 Tax=Spongiactinospora rosea TaxID=2248750 RepID=UPI001314681C|nr:ATP-binding protein [Spongiactinospora rosea]
MAVRRFRLAADDHAPSRARRLSGRTARRWGLPVDEYCLALVTSELVTNATRHATPAGGVVWLVLAWETDRLRVTVHDPSPVPPRPHRLPDPITSGTYDGDRAAWESGRGLIIVQALASGWGWEHTRWGKRVYVTLPLIPAT